MMKFNPPTVSMADHDGLSEFARLTPPSQMEWAPISVLALGEHNPYAGENGGFKLEDEYLWDGMVFLRVPEILSGQLAAAYPMYAIWPTAGGRQVAYTPSPIWYTMHVSYAGNPMDGFFSDARMGVKERDVGASTSVSKANFYQGGYILRRRVVPTLLLNKVI